MIGWILEIITIAALIITGYLLGKMHVQHCIKQYAQAFADATNRTRENKPEYKSMILMLSSITSMLYSICISSLTVLERNKEWRHQPDAVLSEIISDLAMAFTSERISMIEDRIPPPVGED